LKNNIQKIKNRLAKSQIYLPKIFMIIFVLGFTLVGAHLLINAHAQSTSPTVSITNLSENGYVHTNSQVVDVTATANDGGSGSIASCQLSINSTDVGSAVTAAPYNFSFDTLDYPNGSANVSVSCTDDQDDVGTASFNEIVNNGDLTDTGSVGISDLAILASNWWKTGQTYAEGNI
jgi:hypothetical protein